MTLIAQRLALPGKGGAEEPRTDPRIRLSDPALTPFGAWLPANRSFYDCFRRWLKDGGHGSAAFQDLRRRGSPGPRPPRQALLGSSCFPTTWTPCAAILVEHYAPSTQADYAKGLRKLEAYLRLRCRCSARPDEPNWPYFVGPSRRGWPTTCAPSWPTAPRLGPRAASGRATHSLLSHLTLFFCAGRHRPPR